MNTAATSSASRAPDLTQADLERALATVRNYQDPPPRRLLLGCLDVLTHAVMIDPDRKLVPTAAMDGRQLLVVPVADLVTWARLLQRAGADLELTAVARMHLQRRAGLEVGPLLDPEFQALSEMGKR